MGAWCAQSALDDLKLKSQAITDDVKAKLEALNEKLNLAVKLYEHS